MTDNNLSKQTIFQELICIFNYKKRLIVFAYFSFMAIIILLFFSLPLLFSHTSKTIFGGFQEFAVPYETEIINGKVRMKIVWLADFEADNTNVGDLLAIRDSNTNGIWIEKIISIDFENSEVITSFDGLLANRTSFSEIEGNFIKEANFLGNFYYSISRPLGLAIMTLAIILSLIVAYIGFVNNVKCFRQRIEEKYQYEKNDF